MSTHRQLPGSEFDRLASAWLSDGPTELNDRVLDDALSEIHRTHQRRRPPAPWRLPFMPASRLTMFTGASLAAVAVVVVLALSVHAPSPGPGASTSASPGASSTTTATPAATSSPLAAGPTPAIPHGPLAGTYTTSVFTPATTFTVVPGWSDEHEATDELTLWMGDPLHELIVARVVGDPLVYPRSNPLWTIGAPKATTVAGLPAQEIDLALSSSANKANGFFPLAPLPETDSGTVDVRNPGSTCRLWVVQVNGQQVVVLSQRPTGESSTFDAQVDAFLTSLRFGS